MKSRVFTNLLSVTLFILLLFANFNLFAFGNSSLKYPDNKHGIIDVFGYSGDNIFSVNTIYAIEFERAGRFKFKGGKDIAYLLHRYYYGNTRWKGATSMDSFMPYFHEDTPVAMDDEENIYGVEVKTIDGSERTELILHKHNLSNFAEMEHKWEFNLSDEGVSSINGIATDEKSNIYISGVRYGIKSIMLVNSKGRNISSESMIVIPSMFVHEWHIEPRVVSASGSVYVVGQYRSESENKIYVVVVEYDSVNLLPGDPLWIETPFSELELMPTIDEKGNVFIVGYPTLESTLYMGRQHLLAVGNTGKFLYNTDLKEKYDIDNVNGLFAVKNGDLLLTYYSGENLHLSRLNDAFYADAKFESRKIF